MAHHNRLPLIFLETPYGYLTTNGVSDDINDKNLIVLRVTVNGIWAELKKKVKCFLDESEIEDKELRKNILDRYEECKIHTYHCGKNSCVGCLSEKLCVFFNGDKTELELGRLY